MVHMKQHSMDSKLAKGISCRMEFDREILNYYSVDASPYRLRPLAVAFPKTEKDVISVLDFARKNKIQVTPRGAGTGLVGGDLGRGIILDMKYFDKIHVGKDFVEVGSGALKGNVDKALRCKGKFLSPDPSIGPFCTIGGMIGTNASGGHSIKYGSMIDNLIGVKIATSDGCIIKLPTKRQEINKVLLTHSRKIQKCYPQVTKNSCGYRIDAVTSPSHSQRILAGSEGTLGIIISARIRIRPIPKRTVLIIVAYDSMREAIVNISKILKIGPSALEIVDQSISRMTDFKLPRTNECLLFIEFDDSVSRKMNDCKKAITGKMLFATEDYKIIKKLWSYRNSALAYTLKSKSADEIIIPLIEDATVPVHRLQLLLDLIDHLKSKYPLRVIVYGHVGNGNLHLRGMLNERDKCLVKKITREFFYGVISIGGTITGEHGDGIVRSTFVKLQYGTEAYLIFKKLKVFFDPTNTLSPRRKVR